MTIVYNLPNTYIVEKWKLGDKDWTTERENLSGDDNDAKNKPLKPITSRIWIIHQC